MAVRVWGGGAAPAWPAAHAARAVREDAAPGSPLGAPLQASSPLRRRLIYTLHTGAADLFEIHFDTGETSRPPRPAPARPRAPLVLTCRFCPAAPDRGSGPCEYRPRVVLRFRILISRLVYDFNA